MKIFSLIEKQNIDITIYNIKKHLNPTWAAQEKFIRGRGAKNTCSSLTLVFVDQVLLLQVQSHIPTTR